MGKLLKKPKFLPRQQTSLSVAKASIIFLLATVVLSAMVFYIQNQEAIELAQAQGTIYYLDPANGNDGNSGLIDSPWKTFDKMIEFGSLNPGDTVYIRGGTYTEDQYFNAAHASDWLLWRSTHSLGTQAYPITIMAMPGEEVVFDGEFGQYLFWFYAKENPNYPGHYIILKDLNFINYRGIAIRAGYHEGSVGYGVKNIVIDNNSFIDFSDGDSGAVSFEHSQNIVIKNSYFENMGQDIHTMHAIYPGAGNENISIYNNVIINTTGGAIHGYHGPGSKNVLIYNNILIDNHWGIIFADGAENINIFNNVFYNNDVNLGFRHHGQDVSYGVRNVTIKNNILYSSTGIGMNVASWNINDVHLDNNLWYDTSGKPICWNFDLGCDYYSVAEFRANTDNADNSIEADPLFVNAPSDFYLLDDSDAIDNGIDVGIITDFDGNPRDSQPDIGAYEYQLAQSTCRPLDLDCSQVINTQDLLEFKNFWGQSGMADLNQDDITNTSDLGIMLSKWGNY